LKIHFQLTDSGQVGQFLAIALQSVGGEQKREQEIVLDLSMVENLAPERQLKLPIVRISHVQVSKIYFN
jgi:hypothetical protein